MQQQPSKLTAPLLAAAIAALVLGACSKHEERIANQQVNAAVQNVQRHAEAAKSSQTVSDASLIASMNAELARDGKLDPAKIDVDAARGRIALRGTAPDADSVARARRIALSIKGVTGVDNYLTVAKS